MYNSNPLRLILSLITFSLLSCGSNHDKIKQTATDFSITFDSTKFYPLNSIDTLQITFRETAKLLWQKYVPKIGQAETQQGELIRSIERLDNEIRGNAKANWSDQYVLLANSLRDSLIDSKIFHKEIQNEIKADIDSLSRSSEELFLDDAIYNRITRRIVEWYWRHKEPVKHLINPKLKL